MYVTLERGAIVNQGDASKISDIYRAAIDDVVKAALSGLYDQVPVSIYVRGSVATGRATPPLSDIDLVIIFKEAPTKNTREYFLKISKAIGSKYAPDITEIDITATSIPELLYSDSIKNLKIYLKYQSVHLYGEQILKLLPDVYPGPDLAIYMYGDLGSEIESLRNQFSGKKPPKVYQNLERPVVFWCIWMMRTILRSSMALCMFDDADFTQDLRECSSMAKKHYPQLSELIDACLVWAVKPSNDAKEMVDFIDHYVVEYVKLWSARRLRHENEQ